MRIRALNVAEKPSVAKAISDILGDNGLHRRNGRSPYNHIFEFNYKIGGQDVEMHFTSVTGHLMGLDFGQQYTGWRSCDPLDLFTLPVFKTVPQDKEALQRTLEDEARACNWLILWLDCDREGENIAFEVIDVCSKVNRNLKILRAHFSALIPADIRRACQTLQQPNKHLSDAVDARQEIDLRLGAAFTRFQTLRLQPKFAELKDQVVSYGPCQFPTLGFVVQRYMERQNFVSEAFWMINVGLSHDGKFAQFSWSRGRLFDHAASVLLYESCCIPVAPATAPMARVLSVTEKPRRRFKPYPLATIEFQKAASAKLRIGSERAMQIAEDLYTRGFISYPRTETDQFKEGTDFQGLIREQVQDQRWGAFAENLLNGGFSRPRNGKNDDKAHPPIHPTKQATGLDGDTKAVYEYITRRFLACCSEDALAQETSVTIQIASETFSTTGLAISERKYLDVFPYDQWSDCNIPRLHPDETFTPTSIDLVESKTAAPPLLAEHDLITLMDRNGIGTDATVAQHIATIQKRHYAEKRDNVFHPTQLGIGLVASYEAMMIELHRPSLRATMEQEMNAIGRGEKTREQVVQECMEQMREIFRKVVQRANVLEAAMAEFFQPTGQVAQVVQRGFSRCGACNGDLELRSDQGSMVLFCTTCQRGFDAPRNAALSATAHTCPICNFQVIEAHNQERDRKYNFCPQCYSNPPLEFVGGSNKNASAGVSVSLPCFNCVHPTCPLAKKSADPVCPCSKCQTHMMALKKSSTGSVFISCKGYPECKNSINLPACQSVTVSNQTCPNCSRAPIPRTENNGQVHLLNFVFRPGSMPSHIPLNATLCILCDDDIREFCGGYGGGSGGGGASLGAQPLRTTHSAGAVSLSSSSSAVVSSSTSRLRGLFWRAPAAISLEDDDGDKKSSSGFARPQPRGHVTQNSNTSLSLSAFNRPGSTFPASNSFSAPSSSSSFSASKYRCFNCNEEGHVSTNCPQKQPSSSSSSSSTRSNFGMSRSNPLDEIMGDEFNLSTSYSSSSYSSSSASSSSSSSTCYRCGQTGHYANACPNKSSSSSSSFSGAGGGSNFECYKCHQTGHFSKDCPNSSSSSSSSSFSYGRGGSSSGSNRGRGRGGSSSSSYSKRRGGSSSSSFSSSSDSSPTKRGRRKK